MKITTRNICNKKNKTINKGVLCKTCLSPIHRMCCKLKLSDIYDIGKDKWRWKCLTGASTNFLFTAVEDKVILKNGFNSNLHCKRQRNFDLGDSEY